ncbi:MAG: hypothetical protein JNK05_38220 [Myxococcales bacterium]|nr:hypothetical protein [Myxococcales bacterium]
MNVGTKSDGTFERVDAQRLTISRTTKALLLPLVALPMAGAGPTAAVVVMIATVLWSLGVLAYGAKRRAFGLEATPAAIEVSEAAIKIDGTTYTRDAIDNATVARDPVLDGYRVTLSKRRAITGRRLLFTKDEQTARRIVEKLGLDATRSTATWTAGGGLYSKRATVATFGAGLLPMLLVFFAGLWLSPALAVAAIPAALCAAAMLFSRTTVVVGTDGVLVRWLGFSRFCRFDEVREVVALSNGARLVKHDGAAFDVILALARDASMDAYGAVRAEVESLNARIRDAMTARAASSDATVARDPFVRGQRSTADWLNALRNIFDAGDNLRAPAHTEESAWRVVLDTSASDDARVGAAAAIALNADDRSRERLRAVAETVADNRVRVALEAAATGDEAALADAMTTLESKSSRS